MNDFLQKHYQTIIKGGVITVMLMIWLFSQINYFILDESYVSTPFGIFINMVSFLLCWSLISFLIHQFNIYKVLGVTGLLVAAATAEAYLDISKNPITIPALILFWLGITYFILPQFFKKYKTAIIAVYGLVISYYFFHFATATNYSGNHRATFSNIMIAPIPVFTLLWIYEQWRWLKTLQADKTNAELALLKSQINPHFFFNTLNNLYGLAIEKSDKAPEVILKLSDMMRYTIYEGKEDEVLLKDEMSYLENYIELHKLRYRKKVDISFSHDVDKKLKVAPLLFIILLENAFKHGVEKLRENAFIHMKMNAQGNQLYFTIENNFDETASNEKSGIGLDNLKKRLAYLYPNRYELTIEKQESIYKVQLNIQL